MPHPIHPHPKPIHPQGYLGSLGQGDFQPRATYTPIDALSHFLVLDFAAGWAHSAVLTKCGRLFLFGRPHDVRKALRYVQGGYGPYTTHPPTYPPIQPSVSINSLRHMWQTFPFLVRLNQAMKRVLDAPSAEAATYYREDVLLIPR